MKIGYARFSTKDQNLNLQLDALKSVGCEKIYTEEYFDFPQAVDRRTKGCQPVLATTLMALCPGDTLVIWSLDRLGISMAKLLVLIEELREKQIELEIITQKLETTTIMGRAFLMFVTLFTESEKVLFRERSRAGLKRIKVAGRGGGNKPKLSAEAVQEMWNIYSNPKREVSVSEIAKMFGVSLKTVYNYMTPIVKKEDALQAQNSLFPDNFSRQPNMLFGDFPMKQVDI